MHFAVTWDYRCPFARNFHEHVLAALEAGASWNVDFVPFSLLEVHVPEGGTSVFADESKRDQLLALSAGVVVRDRHPEAFARVHRALFAARHDEARDLADREVLADVLTASGLDGPSVLAAAEEPRAIRALGEAHHDAVERFRVFGVPTVILDDGRAAFVRLMTRPNGDGALARRTLDHVLGTFDDHPEINELKFTTIPR
ncbi:DSBA oxidoreductase [Acidimicrobium ferrooxidans DSM 10331]|uniref:DSBA oxidoreductase n=1 Tax=Acidimicrobium ferrooxidans (strain DSM 10331 / JCM 15462 / NBRC 103882 / ICP) TaxID=525909 RepID=C7LY94_ACIFD|nr:DsbA family protein [Acidimicrobium ferrooxidans]ACU53702.1 DSBA oxidoreductase [Acidimicrobium ferrooxidans DSM 10331]